MSHPLHIEVSDLFTDCIEINRRVMLGKPVIRGTRIPVELILRKLSDSATRGDLLHAYPHLTREDVRAALRYTPLSSAHNKRVPQNTRIALIIRQDCETIFVRACVHFRSASKWCRTDSTVRMR